MDFEFEAPFLYKKRSRSTQRKMSSRFTTPSTTSSTTVEHRGEGLAGSNYPGWRRYSATITAAWPPSRPADVTETDPNIYYARAAGFNPVSVSHRLSNILSAYTDIKAVGACCPPSLSA